jgi:nicotinate-nucleotide--dimethylbenzimidazole phosphoribosyltransferase
MRQTLDELRNKIPRFDEAAAKCAAARQAMLAKPPGSLGRLESLAIQLAGITGRLDCEIREKHLLVFAADNGVTAQGVSCAPQSVTLQQTINLTRGKTGASVLARHFGCRLTVCDVGVNAEIIEPAVLNQKIAYGTGDITKGPAMTRKQAIDALLCGAGIAQNAEGDVLGVGEMGIGNTTTSSAVLAVLQDAAVAEVTGRGGGLTEEGFLRKCRAIETAIQKNRPDRTDVIDVLSKVGGFDLAAMCGAFLGGAASRRPVVIDGFISAVAALCAVRLCPGVQDYLIPSHASTEIGWRRGMEVLSLMALFDLVMRLGEGSGCPFAFEILSAACAVMNQMATFDEAGIDDGYLEAVLPERKKLRRRLILISGANGSGKSRYAERLVARLPGPRAYIATMRPVTEENQNRIAAHRRQREHLGFRTLELPYKVGDAPVSRNSVVLLEDVSNLLANVMFERSGDEQAVLDDLSELLDQCGVLIAVTISGLAPTGGDEQTDAYVARLNRLNAELLERADAAVRLENGTPTLLKGDLGID